MTRLLDVQNLTVGFRQEGAVTAAVRGISFHDLEEAPRAAGLLSCWKKSASATPKAASAATPTNCPAANVSA